jgi:hypothetical protein
MAVVSQRGTRVIMKKPKLWDIHIPTLFGFSHARRTSWDDDLDDITMKEVGTWDMIKVR